MHTAADNVNLARHFIRTVPYTGCSIQNATEQCSSCFQFQPVFQTGAMHLVLPVSAGASDLSCVPRDRSTGWPQFIHHISDLHKSQFFRYRETDCTVQNNCQKFMLTDCPADSGATGKFTADESKLAVFL
jgi:hypothetical protein